MCLLQYVCRAFMPVSGELRLSGMYFAYFVFMHMNLITATANDNFPENVALEATGGNNAPAPLVLSAVTTSLSPILTSSAGSERKESKHKKLGQKKTGGRFPVYTLLLLWLIMAVVIARFIGSAEGNLISGENLVMATSAFGLLSLWLAALARRRQAKISHSIGIAGACVCAAGLAWLYFSQQTSMAASPELLVMGVATSSLILAKLWRTPFLLHLSLFMSVGWTSFVFLNAQISDFVWLFPALWSLQMLLALNFHVKRSIILSIFTGLYWIGVNLFLLA